MKVKVSHHIFITGFCSLYVLISPNNANKLFAQARLMMGATATYINISNGGYLVIDNPAANAITRSAGWIISEGASATHNRVKWNISNTAATYTVPFGHAATDFIPVAFTIGSAGSAGGSFIFSTYTTSCTNSSSLPGGGPTNYYSSAIGGDASVYGIDRFWEINATSYGTEPDLSYLRFSYANADAVVGGCNTGLDENTLKAQRWNFNATDPGWQSTGNTFLKGTSTPASNIIELSGAAVVSGANDLNNSNWWTLVSSAGALPVQWLSVSAECISQDVNIRWSTASEKNASHFTVERSSDGTTFSPIGTKPASINGYSSTVKNYSFIDKDPLSGTSYYRIRETDFNGDDYSVSDQITSDGCSSEISFSVYPNPVSTSGSLNIAVTGTQDAEVLIIVTDMLGREFYSKVLLLSNGREVVAIDPTQQLAAGVYTVIATSNDEIQKKKIVIQ